MLNDNFKINPIFGLLCFVIFVVAFAYITEEVSRKREAVYKACIEANGTKFHCGFKSAFGYTNAKT